jgi:hypothetical protein
MKKKTKKLLFGGAIAAIGGYLAYTKIVKPAAAGYLEEKFKNVDTKKIAKELQARNVGMSDSEAETHAETMKTLMVQYLDDIKTGADSDKISEDQKSLEDFAKTYKVS